VTARGLVLAGCIAAVAAATGVAGRANEKAQDTAHALQATANQAAVQTPGTQRYTGAPVNFDFEDADLRGVLRLFQEISGLNVVIDPDIKGTVNLVLRNVPWDQALDVILKSHKLGYLVDGTIVRIAALSSLADEEEQRRKLADAQANAGDLRVVTKQLSYAKAEELQGLLKSVLSKRGNVQIDHRTNTLIVTDLEARLKAVDDLVGSLDHAQPQVEIEARIVQTNKNYARQLGINWGFNARVDPSLGNTTGLAFPNSGSLGGRVGPVQGPNGASTAVNLPVGAATSAVGLALGAVNGAFNLDIALSALESSGNGRILSTPRVATLNNVEAQVTQGVQIPLQTISNNTVTVDFRDAALTLKVMPQITAADTVIMRVALENSTPDFSRAAGPAAIPPINTQRAITTLLVNDGQTTVIGGIYTSNQQTSSDRTPGLSRVPILSWLFKRDRIDDQSNELLIFITPRIIR
jgi:type IV pilus assembly protein PilQ